MTWLTVFTTVPDGASSLSQSRRAFRVVSVMGPQVDMRLLQSDLDWERSYDGMKAYSSSKIAFGLFGLELDRRSKAAGWGITSNLSHPGIAPTALLAARPEVGRSRDTLGRRLIRVMSARGILVGTVETAGLPALLAATDPAADGGRFFGPRGFRNLGGAPAEQPLYSRLDDPERAARVWDLSLLLTGMTGLGTPAAGRDVEAAS